MSFRLISRLLGKEVAIESAKRMEYELIYNYPLTN
jgi:hypothetical protein